jgi:hypothetical protein
MIAHTRFVGLESVSIADALTATNIQLGVPEAHGLVVPVSALAGGSTLAFYFRNDQQFQQGIGSVFVDARAVLDGSQMGYTDSGAITQVLSRFFIDGFDVSQYATNVIVANSGREKYQLYVIRFDNIPRQAGFFYVAMDSAGANYQPIKLADLRLYDYTVSLAQISAPLLPFDYVTRYTFADYEPGDSVVTDVSGNGNHGVVFF